MSRQLTAFTRLGPLGDLDLDLIGIDKVMVGYPKASRSHLFDGTPGTVPVFPGKEPRRVLAAFTRVAPPAKAVHGDGQGLMRFTADGTIRHGPGDKPFGDGLHGLNF